MRRIIYYSVVILILICSTITTTAQTNFIWGKQFGSAKDEYSLNHVVDLNGNIYVSGKTTGDIDGKNAGKNDGFLYKTDSLGNTVWTRQFGSAGDEDIQWSAIDNSGNMFITGTTTGVLSGKNFGKEDIIIVKYNPQGMMEWSNQLGTDSTDIAKGICTDKAGNIYITGLTGGKLGQTAFGKTDFFIIKLDNKGNQLFTSQYGTPGDDCGYSITVTENSEIWLCGTTWGDLGDNNKGFIDGFTGRFTDRGVLIKYNQFGTSGFDIAMILNVDSSRNIFVGGSTSGNMGSQQIGDGDCFLLKMSEKGEILWNNQFGTKRNDGLRGIFFDPLASDKILVSGILNLPPAQAFIRMYKNDGTFLWEQKFISVGKNGDTSGKDVSADKKGNIYHLGLTGANLFGPNIGEHDVYIVKLRK